MLKLIKPAPNKLWIAVTNTCNLRCRHCLVKAGVSFKTELSTKKIYQIIKEAVNLGVKRIAFTGGEPLLRSDIISIIKYASSFGIRTYLETNGALLTNNLINKLKTAGLEVLNLSLDGPTPKIHDKFRGKKGLFEKVIKSIYQAVKIGLDVRVYYTVTTQNIYNVEEIPKLFIGLPRKLGVLTYAYFIPLGRGKTKYKWMVPPNQWVFLCKKLNKLIKLYKNNFPIRYEPVFLTKNNLKKIQKTLPYNISCLAHEKDWLYISPQGRVYGCIFLINTNKILGNIIYENLADIWLDSKKWSFFESTNNKNMGCKVLTSQIKGSKSNEDTKSKKLNKNLVPICPLTQYPKIEPWPYENKVTKI